jgi:hypothetical protein
MRAPLHFTCTGRNTKKGVRLPSLTSEFAGDCFDPVDDVVSPPNASHHCGTHDESRLEGVSVFAHTLPAFACKLTPTFLLRTLPAFACRLTPTFFAHTRPTFWTWTWHLPALNLLSLSFLRLGHRFSFFSPSFLLSLFQR